MNHTTTKSGIPQDARQKTARRLGMVHADTFTLYLKTHHYHWNVTGPQFPTLHRMFEEQYQDLWAAVDDVAERIRALGSPAPGTYQEFTDNTTLALDKPGEIPPAEGMVSNLVDGHERIARTIREVLHDASEAGDDVTADLLTQRLQSHEKTAWILRSVLA